jgi:hypothetical protein
MQLAISVIRRCLEGDCVELGVKILKHSKTHRCHDNVREWVQGYPKHKHVYGFFIADRRPFSDGTLVIPHSVVEDEHGKLWDITPNENEVTYSFVRHQGSMDEFDLIGAHEPHTKEVPHELLRQFPWYCAGSKGQ